MSDRDWIEPIVERVVGQVLDGHVAQLRSEIVRRVMEEIGEQPAASAAQSTSAACLALAVSGIQLGTSQKEILRALLDSSACCASRVALFVVKGSQAMGWQGRGFANGDGIKDFALDFSAPAVVRAIGDRNPTSTAANEFDTRFLEKYGAPAGEGRLLPLILKDKVAALVYADGGTEGALLDASSLDILVLSASAWLEVNALRKQAHKETLATPAESHGSPVQATAPATAYNDPFAAHAPAFAMAAAAPAGAPATVAPEPPQAVESGVIAELQGAPVEDQLTASAAATASAEDTEIHSKARRFARLLVDEIKLYNQAKVSEGRKNKDLYDRLKDTIEKSRTTYQKRYGNTVAGSGNYFQHEVLRSLAEDDASLMGANFHL